MCSAWVQESVIETLYVPAETSLLSLGKILTALRELLSLATGELLLELSLDLKTSLLGAFAASAFCG